MTSSSLRETYQDHSGTKLALSLLLYTFWECQLSRVEVFVSLGHSLVHLRKKSSYVCRYCICSYEWHLSCVADVVCLPAFCSLKYYEVMLAMLVFGYKQDLNFREYYISDMRNSSVIFSIVQSF